MNHYIVKCHGVNLSTKLFTVPDDTCIITVTATGVSLRDLIVKMTRISVKILASDPPIELFTNGNTTKVKTDQCRTFEFYLRKRVEPEIEDGEIITEGEHGDPNINFRNHLPGDVLPDIYLSTNEPNPEKKKFFGIHTKIPGQAIKIENREMHMNLTDLIKRKKGVYILFVCRTDDGLDLFKSKFKTEPDFREIVNLYLAKIKQGQTQIAEKALTFLQPQLRPILIDLGDKGITDIVQAMSYLNDTPPPPLALSRKHSQTTDENEEEVQNILQTLTAKYSREIKVLQDEIDKLSSPEFRRGKSKETIQYIDEKIVELKTEMKKLVPPISTIRRNTHYPEIDGGKTKRKRRKTNKYKRR